MKVLGVGFGRTGTLSLKHALEDLGVGPCFHMIDLIRYPEKVDSWHDATMKGEMDWEAMFDGFESTIDWPGCTFWRDMADAYPDAPVLLNVRDFDGWYRSVENTIFALRQATLAGAADDDAGTENQPSARLWEVIGTLIWQRDFQGRFEDKDWMRRMYEDRIQMIRDALPADRLTVYELGSGWEPITNMLDVETPDHEFPHLHDTNEWRAQFGLAPV